MGRTVLLGLSALLVGARGESCVPPPGDATATITASAVGCDQDGQYYEVGAAIPAADCNTCSCAGDDVVECTELTCPVVECSALDTLACQQAGASGCKWMAPGCETPSGYVSRVGCFAQCDADADCAVGSHCEAVWTDPCWDDGDATCDACGAEAQVCVPEVCSFEEDGPEGSTCIGSTVCPPYADCASAGEPGTCQPDADASCGRHACAAGEICVHTFSGPAPPDDDGVDSCVSGLRYSVCDSTSLPCMPGPESRMRW